MKNLITLAVVVFFFFPLPVLAQNNLPPVEISAYYAAHNFVVAFSTIPERIEMRLYHSEKDLPDHLISKRHRMIFNKIREVKDKELHPDSGIFVPKGARNMRSDFTGIVQIEDVRYIDDTSVKVETITYKLDHETNAKLVSLYERYNGTDFPLNWSSSATVLYRESHKWIKMNNCWMKDPASVALIEKQRNSE